MQIITAAAIKGGTGKTTTALLLAQAAAHKGKKVLAVDLDPQGDFTFSLKGNNALPGTVDILAERDPLPAADAIQTTPQGIDLIAANTDLAAIRTFPASAMRLQTALEPIKENYDFIFIDTPPAMNETTFNALQASTGLLIPLEPGINSLHGLYRITDIAKQIQKTNPALRILGSVITNFDQRPRLHRYLQNVFAERGADIGVPYLMAIRSAVAVQEAQAFQVSLYEYAPKSKPAQDYLELLQMLENMNHD